MSDRLHMGTFLWGVILTVVGAALAAVGFEWWDLAVLDLRYAAPVIVILIGGVILAGAFISATGMSSTLGHDALPPNSPRRCRHNDRPEGHGHQEVDRRHRATKVTARPAKKSSQVFIPSNWVRLSSAYSPSRATNSS